MVLTRREKLLLAVLALLGMAIGMVMGLRGLAKYQQELAAKLDAAQRTLRQVQAYDVELARIERSKRTRGLDGSLTGYMEQLADRAGVKTRVQLNPITQAAGAKTQVIDVRVDQLTLDETLRFLYTIENAELILVIDQLELSRSFKEKDLLRVSLRVLAQS
jgi:hypothetical protein